MNRIQPVKFRSVGEFLDSLPEDELHIVEILRKLVFETLPDCREKLAYNVPFYYRHSRICYIWPASVPWGGIKTGVAFGFCKGHLLNNEIRYLEKGDRKQVLVKIIREPDEIEPDLLKSFLFEAKLIDEQNQAIR